jgi:hypothetical protein
MGKQVQRSFRVDMDLYHLLEAESREKNISMNIVLNQAIKEYAFKKSFDRINSILTPRDILRNAFDIADCKLLIDRARKIGSNNAVEYVGLLYNEVNEDHVMQFLNIWFSRFQGYNHGISGRTHIFTIPHYINEKYSIFTKEFVTSLIDSTIRRPISFPQITSNIIIFKIDL